MERQPNTQYCLSISYGKDSLACLGAIEKLGLPLDRIIHAEVWATQDIPADLPPMVEFKKKADKIIKERWGIDVEHVYATPYEKKENTIDKYRKKLTYEDVFYREYQKETLEKRKNAGKNIENPIYGFPMNRGGWCMSELKRNAIRDINKFFQDKTNINTVQYIGIAEDELERLERLDNITKISPLHLIGWTEQDAMDWCIKNDLRSPLYDMSNRGGVGFAIIKVWIN